MLVIGKTQNLWNWVCHWVASLLVSAETFKRTASLTPHASEPWEEKKKKRERSWSNSSFLKWLFLEYFVQWCSWGQKQEKEIHSLPTSADHFLSFEIKYKAGGFIFTYCTAVPLISWLAGPLLVAGPAGRTSGDYKTSIWQQILESLEGARALSVRAPYLLRSMSPTPFANSPPRRDNTSCYLSTLGMEMSTAGAIVLKAWAQPGVLFKLEERTPPLHSQTRLIAVVGPLALVWESLTKFMVFLSDFILKM